MAFGRGAWGRTAAVVTATAIGLALACSGASAQAPSGLPGTLDPNAVAQVVNGLASGGPTSGDALKPLAAALRQAASMPGTDPTAAQELNTLADQIDKAGANPLPAQTLQQLASTLAVLGAQTSGLPDQTLATLIGLLGSGGSPTTPAAPQGSGQASGGSAPRVVFVPVIVPTYKLILKATRIRIDRHRRIARVLIKAATPFALPAKLVLRVAGRRGARSRTFTVPPRRTRTIRLRLTRHARSVLRRRGARVIASPSFAVPGLSRYPWVLIDTRAKAIRIRRTR